MPETREKRSAGKLVREANLKAFRNVPKGQIFNWLDNKKALIERDFGFQFLTKPKDEKEFPENADRDRFFDLIKDDNGYYAAVLLVPKAGKEKSEQNPNGLEAKKGLVFSQNSNDIKGQKIGDNWQLTAEEAGKVFVGGIYAVQKTPENLTAEYVKFSEDIRNTVNYRLSLSAGPVAEKENAEDIENRFYEDDNGEKFELKYQAVNERIGYGFYERVNKQDGSDDNWKLVFFTQFKDNGDAVNPLDFDPNKHGFVVDPSQIYTTGAQGYKTHKDAMRAVQTLWKEQTSEIISGKKQLKLEKRAGSQKAKMKYRWQNDPRLRLSVLIGAGAATAEEVGIDAVLTTVGTTFNAIKSGLSGEFNFAQSFGNIPGDIWTNFVDGFSLPEFGGKVIIFTLFAYIGVFRALKKGITSVADNEYKLPEGSKNLKSEGFIKDNGSNDSTYFHNFGPSVMKDYDVVLLPHEASGFMPKDEKTMSFYEQGKWIRTYLPQKYQRRKGMVQFNVEVKGEDTLGYVSLHTDNVATFTYYDPKTDKTTYYIGLRRGDFWNAQDSENIRAGIKEVLQSGSIFKVEVIGDDLSSSDRHTLKVFDGTSEEAMAEFQKEMESVIISEYFDTNVTGVSDLDRVLNMFEKPRSNPGAKPVEPKSDPQPSPGGQKDERRSAIFPAQTPES